MFNKSRRKSLRRLGRTLELVTTSWFHRQREATEERFQ